MWFKKEFSIHLIEFDAWWKAIGIQKVSKTIKQQVIHFGYPRCIFWVICQSWFCESVLLTISAPIFLNSYISAIRKRWIDLPTKPMTLDWCSSTMTGVLVLTKWRRHCHNLPIKAGMLLTQQKLWTYYPLPINEKILAQPTFYASSIVRKSHFFAQYHNRYIMWDNPRSTECTEVST